MTTDAVAHNDGDALVLRIQRRCDLLDPSRRNRQLAPLARRTARFTKRRGPASRAATPRHRNEPGRAGTCVRVIELQNVKRDRHFRLAARNTLCTLYGPMRVGGNQTFSDVVQCHVTTARFPTWPTRRWLEGMKVSVFRASVRALREDRLVTYCHHT